MTTTGVVATEPWQTISKRYREAAAAKLPQEWKLDEKWTADVNQTSHQNVLDIPRNCGLLTDRELELTENYDAVALLEKLATGSISSADLTSAFSKRAAIAHQLTNCLTETFFPLALSRAKFCDDYLATHQKPIGPLHGLPISIKDSFNIKGIASTIGYISFIDHGPATQDSALVTILLDLGAVLYVKTNIPQSLMTADSDNNVFGRVLNPNKLCLGAGGSSGGEGALVAMKGSPIGVGTDIAGSIRIPAYCDGTLGFKPSARRVPYGGQKSPSRAGSPWILPVAGPLARSVRDVEVFMKAVLGYDVWSVDETVMSLPWRSVSLSSEKKLKLGYIIEDSRYPLHPPVLRAMKTAIKKLEKAGHEMIDLGPQLPANALYDAMDVSFTGFALDPAKTSTLNMTKSGEPPVPSIAGCSLPELKYFNATVDNVYDLNAARAKMCAMFHKLWTKNGIDAILMPTYQATAVAHDKYGVPIYTVLANLLDYPGFTIPYLNADKSFDAEYRRDVTYIPAYVPDEVEGAPAGIQLMGRPHRDEELVAITPIVMEALDL